jgi:hypothetical protein
MHRPVGQRVDELRGPAGRRRRHAPARAPLRGDAAVGQHDHLVGDAEGLFQVVRDDDAGDAQRVVQLADQLGRRAQRNGVEAGERLVVHHQVGIERDGARQRDAARHAARHLAGHQVARAAQADGIELHQHDVAHQRLGQLRVLTQRERHVVEHRHVGEQVHRTGTACPCAAAPHTAQAASAARCPGRRTAGSPRCARTWPPIRRSTVVLPPPEAPISAVTLPRGTEKRDAVQDARARHSRSSVAAFDQEREGFGHAERKGRARPGNVVNPAMIRPAPPAELRAHPSG